MKYHFIDRLTDFEFHDSEWSLISWMDNELVLSVRYLNVHKTTLPEPRETDMEIEEARMIFRNLSELTYEPGRTWKKDENGDSYTDDPLVIHSGEIALELFLNEMKEGIWINYFVYEDRKFEIGGAGVEPYFTCRFNIRQLEIAWDSFRKPAWYTESKFVRKE